MMRREEVRFITVNKRKYIRVEDITFLIGIKKENT